MISIRNLYSGSRGNATLVRLGDTRILIDAGKSARSLCRALEAVGENIDDISAVFLTHEHRDHTAALPILLKHHFVPVHVVSASLEKMKEVGDVTGSDQEAYIAHPPLFCVTVGGMTVTSFPTPHDSAASVGYRITWAEDGKEHAFGYATDTGTVTDDMRRGMLGCEVCVVESNHDVTMLREGPYVYPLKRRILSKTGHLSNEDCSAFCAELAGAGAKTILLAHLSEQNNLPEIAFAETAGVLAGTGTRLLVASPDSPTLLCGEVKSEKERETLC